MNTSIEPQVLHRYRFAATAAQGCDVLDISCGEGHGSSILAAGAKSVLALGTCAETLERARSNHTDPRLSFQPGDAAEIPLPDGSVDLLVWFPELEPLGDPGEIIREFQRVLRPEGLLLTSGAYLREEAARRFDFVKHYQQWPGAASLITQKADKAIFEFLPGPAAAAPTLDLTIASRGELPDFPHSAFGTTLDAHSKLEAAQTELKELASKLEASEALADQTHIHLRNVIHFTNEVLSNKWWRITRHFRRWSNSLRRRCGRPVRYWPEQLELPNRAGPATAGAGGDVSSMLVDFTTGISVVPFSSVRERFVEYVEHEPIDPIVRTIAFYLPQYHPFAQNDAWWGKGFTDWTNVGRAHPLFPGHHQPHCPIHLGYYDLRVPEVMHEQARLARNYGISGFAYYFHWFAGKPHMEMALQAMLADPQVDMPFCLIWANETLTRGCDTRNGEVLISQDHSKPDSRAMLQYVAQYMNDDRYIRVDGKPLFIIQRADLIADLSQTIEMWREDARQMGIGELYIICAQTSQNADPKDAGLDAEMEFPPQGVDVQNISHTVQNLAKGFNGRIFDYRETVSAAVQKRDPGYTLFKTTMLSRDDTAKCKLDATIFHDFGLTPYAQWLASNMERAAKDTDRTNAERIVFIDAWNLWAEGTHLEPDQKYGYGYLEASRSVIDNFPQGSETFWRPEIPKSSSARFAVVAHLHYRDTWPEMRRAILELGPVDVYVTVTDIELAREVASDMPAAIVELVDNRGRDVRPFLRSLQQIDHLGYRAICKIHGKKSLSRSDGDTLRRRLFGALLDPAIMTRFEENETLGFLAPASAMLPHDAKRMRGNRKLVDQISREIGVPFVPGQFAAGTMFWVDPRAIAPILRLAPDEFDIERGLADGTRPHAIERVFCGVCESQGFEVGTIDDAG